MEKHIIANNDGMLISKYRNSGLIPVRDRRKIIANVAELLVEHYGLENISMYNKIAVSKALIELFPILKCNIKGVEPIVSKWEYFIKINPF